MIPIVEVIGNVTAAAGPKVLNRFGAASSKMVLPPINSAGPQGPGGAAGLVFCVLSDVVAPGGVVFCAVVPIAIKKIGEATAHLQSNRFSLHRIGRVLVLIVEVFRGVLWFGGGGKIEWRQYQYKAFVSKCQYPQFRTESTVAREICKISREASAKKKPPNHRRLPWEL